MGDITRLLDQARGGDAAARDALFTRVYAELQQLARRKLARESTLTQIDAPSLVHEAYLRLTRQAKLPGDNRRMFFAYASSVMRSVIVDYVHARNARKRGSGERPLTLTSGTVALADVDLNPDVEALDSALTQLAKLDPRSHQVVEMRYFGGLSIEDISEVLGIAPATVKRDWQKARAFLYTALTSA
jgi:RNA polymerase sigma factor (TIGR02999 family)